VEIRLAASALEDIAEIRRYYQEQGVPEVGERLVSEVIEHIEHLADHPDIGRMVPEFGAANLREFIHPPLRIYWREAARVSLIRIWRSERQLRLPGQ
jgi:plasmid stabilization system protein ParE